MSTQTTNAAEPGAVIPWWTLGDRIRKARLTIDMDQRRFAEALSVPAGSLAAWETDRQRPRDLVAVAKRIELLTQIPAAWILGLDVASPRPVDPDGGTVRHQGLEPRTRWISVFAGQDERTYTVAGTDPAEAPEYAQPAKVLEGPWAPPAVAA